MGVHWLASFFFPAPEHLRVLRAGDDRPAAGEKSKGRRSQLWLPVAGGGALLLYDAEHPGVGYALALLAYRGFPFPLRLEALPTWRSEYPFRQPQEYPRMFCLFLLKNTLMEEQAE